MDTGWHPKLFNFIRICSLKVVESVCKCCPEIVHLEGNGVESWIHITSNHYRSCWEITDVVVLEADMLQSLHQWNRAAEGLHLVVWHRLVKDVKLAFFKVVGELDWRCPEILAVLLVCKLDVIQSWKDYSFLKDIFQFLRDHLQVFKFAFQLRSEDMIWDITFWDHGWISSKLVHVEPVQINCVFL